MNARLPQRISIIGPSASGKSVLARALTALADLPHHELDTLRNPAIAEAADDERFRAAVAALVATPEWICDGHYRCIREPLWDRAQMIVWLNYGLPRVLWQTGRRMAARQRKAPPRRAERPARGLGGRLSRLRRTLIERGEFRRLLDDRAAQGQRIVELRSPAAARRWLESLAD